MDRMIACCGLICTDCPAFQATRNDDDEARKSVAEMWSKMYNAEIKPEEINCEGCLSSGERLFNHCKVCAIRKCASEKDLINCAYCDEYSCEKLNDIFKAVTEAKETLDEIKKSL